MRLTSSVSVAQTIIALSSVELTSILVPSHQLRIMALLSSGCRATVDGLTNVQGSSTTQQWQATSLDDNNLHVPCRQSSKHFISGQLKVIPLFRYSVIPYSAFYSIPHYKVFQKFFFKRWNTCVLLPTLSLQLLSLYTLACY